MVINGNKIFKKLFQKLGSLGYLSFFLHGISSVLYELYVGYGNF